MPCRDYGYEEYEAQKTKEKLDMLTRNLCAAMKLIEKKDLLIKMPMEAREWWTKHKELDAKEEAKRNEELRKQKLKNAALDKLSPEEKTLLGLR